MKKLIITLVVCITGLACTSTAQTTIQWNDSTVTFKGTKVSQSIILDNVKKPSLQSDFYYAFDKKTKTHIIHLVKTSIKNDVKSLYLIYKYLIPAHLIDGNQLKVETAENSSYASGGFLYVSLRCKDDKEEIIFFEKNSHYFDFENQDKTNEVSIEAELTEKEQLKKLIQLIKQNK